MKKVVTGTLLFTIIAYLTVGLIGYATFSSNINILSGENYANSVITVAYGYTLEGVPQPYPFIILFNMITMCASIIISQPFNIKPSKDALQSSCRTVLKKAGLRESDDPDEPETTREHWTYVLITLYTCVLVVLFSDSAQMVMNIVGSSFMTTQCFIFPSMFYLKIKGDTLTTTQKAIHWALIIGNGLFALWNTTENIIQAI